MTEQLLKDMWSQDFITVLKENFTWISSVEQKLIEILKNVHATHFRTMKVGAAEHQKVQ